MHRGLALFLGMAALALAVGCGNGDGEAEPEPASELEAIDEAWARVAPDERLTGTHGSVRALTGTFLERLETRDLAGLRALALTPGEFRGIVWPQLPSSRPERNLTWSFVWGDLNQKSGNALRSTLERHGGRAYELMRVEFQDETTNYGTYKVHRDARVVVVDEEGEMRRLDLFGSVIERQGDFKIFSFVVD